MRDGLAAVFLFSRYRRWVTRLVARNTFNTVQESDNFHVLRLKPFLKVPAVHENILKIHGAQVVE